MAPLVGLYKIKIDYVERVCKESNSNSGKLITAVYIAMPHALKKYLLTPLNDRYFYLSKCKKIIENQITVVK